MEISSMLILFICGMSDTIKEYIAKISVRNLQKRPLERSRFVIG